MITSIATPAGAVTIEKQLDYSKYWFHCHGRDLDWSGFDPETSLECRIAVAQSFGLQIGTILSRFSTKMQQSTDDQIRDCLRFAATNGIYVPPEYICVDEGVSGKKNHRVGLDRAKSLLKSKKASVLLVFKVSRLFRVGYLGFQFFNENVVELGLRAISTSQGIDTDDRKTWKQLAYLHGIMDEMLLTAIADHVRLGLMGLFQAGYVVGALTVGYDGVEVPGSRPTNLGRPRRMPQVNPNVGEKIREHYQMIRDGMTIREGWKRWVREVGVCDKRSRTGRMSYNAYRRLLSNTRYLGIWAFGRKRNNWSVSKNYTEQKVQPDTDVKIIHDEKLRIVSDELFHAVQAILSQYKIGPRGPKKTERAELWDRVTDCFFCRECSEREGKLVRYYVSGANGKGMSCKNRDFCPAKTIVRREYAVRAIIDKLTSIMNRDSEFVQSCIARTMSIDPRQNVRIQEELHQLERDIEKKTRNINDLMEISGEGNDEDRRQIISKIRQTNHDRSLLRSKEARLKLELSEPTRELSPEKIREKLLDAKNLLIEAARGALGDDMIYRAVSVFRILVNEQIIVSVEKRAGRKIANVFGTLSIDIFRATQQSFGILQPVLEQPMTLRVSLRPIPKRDQLADRVHQLIAVEKHSYRSAAKVLQNEGHNINSGVVWQIYRRYFEMHSLPMPEMPYNNGNARE